MKELTRKNYRIDVELPQGFFGRFFKLKKKKLVFKYKQGTFLEVLEMAKWIDEKNDLTPFVYDFLNTHGKITKRQFVKIGQPAMIKIFRHLEKTFAKGYFDNARKDVEVDPDKKPVVKTPSYSAIAAILMSSNETVSSLLDLTWEAFNFLSDGILWNLNERTTAGKRANLLKASLDEERKKMSDDDVLDSLKDFEKKLNKSNNGTGTR